MASFPHNATTEQTLLQASEQALDIAKFEGRDRVKISQDSIQPSSESFAWKELAKQAKSAVATERQTKKQNGLANYAEWMHPVPVQTNERDP